MISFLYKLLSLQVAFVCLLQMRIEKDILKNCSRYNFLQETKQKITRTDIKKLPHPNPQILFFADLIRHFRIIRDQITNKKHLRKLFCLHLFNDLFTANDLYFLKKFWLFNFKITLIIFILTVNRKVYIFKIHGKTLFKINSRICSRKLQR